MQMPVVTRVSQATRPYGSCSRTASSTASEIWSAILSGCPSVTDSDVNKCRCCADIALLKSTRGWSYLLVTQMTKFSCSTVLRQSREYQIALQEGVHLPPRGRRSLCA